MLWLVAQGARRPSLPAVHHGQLRTASGRQEPPLGQRDQPGQSLCLVVVWVAVTQLSTEMTQYLQKVSTSLFFNYCPYELQHVKIQNMVQQIKTSLYLSR